VATYIVDLCTLFTKRELLSRMTTPDGLCVVFTLAGGQSAPFTMSICISAMSQKGEHAQGVFADLVELCPEKRRAVTCQQFFIGYLA